MEKNEVNMGKNKPEKSFRASPVNATVWANETTSSDGTPRLFRTISLERNYKDKDGSWKSSHSLRVNDLPKAILALEKAYEYIAFKEEKDSIIQED
ncbi:MAG: hypothetical protein ACOCQQ_00025 [Candidatus Nanoarchaeia archaeon]